MSQGFIEFKDEAELYDNSITKVNRDYFQQPNIIHQNKINHINQKNSCESYNKSTTKHISDYFNYVILITMYIYQGLVLGFIEGTIPVLLVQGGATFSQLGLLSFTSYPWSFQMLTAPIMDTYYSESFGKRKSYLVPLQLASALIFFIFSFYITDYIDNQNVIMLFFIGIFLEYIYSVQDITVGGWSLTLLQPQNVPNASSCQHVGQTTGNFISFNMYIWLNSPLFINQFFGTNLKQPILDPQNFFVISGMCILIGTLYVTFFKKEKTNQVSKNNINQKTERQQEKQQYQIEKQSQLNNQEQIQVEFKQIQIIHINSNNSELQQKQINENNQTKEDRSIFQTLEKLKGFYKNPTLRLFIIFMLFQSLTTAPVDNLSQLIMLKKGFSREIISTLSLIVIPIQFITAGLASKISQNKKEFTSYVICQCVRVLNNSLAFYITISYQKGVNENQIYILLLINSIIDAVAQTLIFINAQGFCYRMCDVDVGGSYLTMMNSVQNFGNTWTSSLILLISDYISFETQFIISNLIFIGYYGYFGKKLVEFEKQDSSIWKLKNFKIPQKQN